jgi:hypothetical protein
MTIKIPKVFFDDHEARDLPTPAVVRFTTSHYFIASGDPALPELLSDAEHYAFGGIEAGPEYIGLISSARATFKALKSAGVE